MLQSSLDARIIICFCFTSMIGKHFQFLYKLLAWVAMETIHGLQGSGRLLY